MHDNEESKIARFVSGLRREIQDIVELYEYSSLKKVVHLAIKMKSQLLKKPTFKYTHNDGLYKSSWTDTKKNSTKTFPSNFSKETTSHQKVSKHNPSTSTTKSPTKTSRTKCFKCLGFRHIDANCPNKRTTVLQEVNQDQIKTIAKKENEKEEESKVGLILFTPTKITAPPKYTSSFSFSLPNNSKYLTTLLKKFRNDLQKHPKGYPLLKGFSQTNHLFLKCSLQPWPISRIHPCELPKLHEHKFVSHPKHRNIISGNKLTMLFAGVLNSRTNSFQPGGHDTNQSNQQMTKDTSSTSQKRSVISLYKVGPHKTSRKHQQKKKL